MADPRKRKKPLGEPIIRTDEELDALAAISPEDIQQARVMVAGTSQAAAKLLDAQPVKEKDEAKPAQ
jgi:hypothetical protein